MAFLDLPNELIDQIIQQTTPEAFSNLTRTCTRIYACCKPFLAKHQALRKEYRHLTLGHGFTRCSSVPGLLVRISEDPIVAQYIRYGDFGRNDPSFSSYWIDSVPDWHEGGPLVALFAESTYLRQAGLDWKDYYLTFMNDIHKDRWSQHALTFLLTLLPNIEKIVLPCRWRPNEATDRLLDAIVARAQQHPSPTQLTSLARLKHLTHSRDRYVPYSGADLNGIGPLMTLPRMRTFHGQRVIDFAPGLPFVRKSHHIADQLYGAHFLSAHVGPRSIATFLRHAPNLRRLSYKFFGTVSDPHWDVCAFVNAVNQNAGEFLDELSLVDCNWAPVQLIPGSASLRRLKQLKILDISLRLIMCHAIAAAKDREPNMVAYDLIPASVTHLDLRMICFDRFHSYGVKAVRALFHDFQEVCKRHPLALQHVYIACPPAMTVPHPWKTETWYESLHRWQCLKAQRKLSEVGVSLEFDGGIGRDLEYRRDIWNPGAGSHGC